MQQNWFDLTGRVALITGASKGLGRASAEALAQAGADVALASRTRADLEEVADGIRATGRRVLVVPADVADEASIAAMTQAVIDSLGRIDILVNNAGIEGQGAIVDMPVERWDAITNVNLRGPMLCCKHIGPHMISRRSGKVINMASVFATRVARYMSAYAATKGALVQLTRSLALEWIRHDIQVNALCPGYIRTPMNEDWFETDQGKRFIEKLPSGRIGEPDELKAAVVFLASDATSYITGTTLYVDGGHSLA